MSTVTNKSFGFIQYLKYQVLSPYSNNIEQYRTIQIMILFINSFHFSNLISVYHKHIVTTSRVFIKAENLTNYCINKIMS